MRRIVGSLRRELPPTLRLAVPVALAELGWMAMGLVDTLMVSPMGAEAIGAVGLGNVLYFTPAIFGVGLLLGLDTLVSQADGAGDRDDCHHSAVQGVWMSLAIGPVLAALVWFGTPWLKHWGMDPKVVALTVPYLNAIAWDLLPLLLFTVFRRYLQALHRTIPILVTLFIANGANWFGNWLFIRGRWGLPALGVVGSAYSTLCSKIVMALLLIGYAVWAEPGLRRAALGVDVKRIRALAALGWPVAVQITMEVAVFAVAAALAGTLGANALAAHQLVLNLASLTFMVPLGVSSAGAVRVGNAIGAGDRAGAARAGWAAVVLGAGFMLCAGVVFLLIPRTLLAAFEPAPDVLRLSVALLGVAAVFQLFDGLQIVTTGNLRGLGDTRTPMIGNTIAHWVLGLPIGYGLAVIGGYGVIGLWVGLSVGLIAAGVILLSVWAFRAARLRQEPTPELSPSAQSVEEPAPV